MAPLTAPHLGDGNFDPETLEILGVAFEEAWRKIKASNSKHSKPAHAAAARGVIARHIIELAKHGERHPVTLCDSAIAFLAAAPHEGYGRLIRVIKNGGKSSTSYIVGEEDKARAKELIRKSIGSLGDEIQDLGRVSEELLKSMLVGSGAFLPIDGVRQIIKKQQPPQEM